MNTRLSAHVRDGGVGVGCTATLQPEPRHSWLDLGKSSLLRSHKYMSEGPVLHVLLAPRGDLGEKDVARFLCRDMGVISMENEQGFRIVSQNQLVLVCSFEAGSRLVQNLYSSSGS